MPADVVRCHESGCNARLEGNGPKATKAEMLRHLRERHPDVYDRHFA